ncbi:proline-rich receptor-like protein kinase PERK2 [Marmota marmota marmota]|uniref:proline-rich receptor-like protein kinase PERK2 n=1 Tax=Marmota marmota marmota TaxID=9994 RepID=UPI0020938579|nr:proline-rich receptor-like protein kinase PERK2 [Marmota marmota marmota]
MMRYQLGALRDDRPIEKESQGVDSRSDTDGEGRSEAQMPHAGPSFSSCLCRTRGESRPSRCSQDAIQTLVTVAECPDTGLTPLCPTLPPALQPHLAPGGVPVGLDLCCALDLHAPTCALDKGSLAALRLLNAHSAPPLTPAHPPSLPRDLPLPASSPHPSSRTPRSPGPLHWLPSPTPPPSPPCSLFLCLAASLGQGHPPHVLASGSWLGYGV